MVYIEPVNTCEAKMATKTLAQKLYIRPGHTVALLNAPKGTADLLEPLPDEAAIVTSTRKKADVVLAFAKNKAELEKQIKDLKSVLEGDPLLWFAYPKQSSKSDTDLTRDEGWKNLFELGYSAVATVPIDKTWTGVRFRRIVAKSDEELIDKQYEDERAALRPLYEVLANVIRQQGPDVEQTVHQSYVAFKRHNQFALIKPAREHLDLALKLPNGPLHPRLQAATGLGSGSMTHRVEIRNKDEIDYDVLRWLQEAYYASNR